MAPRVLQALMSRGTANQLNMLDSHALGAPVAGSAPQHNHNEHDEPFVEAVQDAGMALQLAKLMQFTSSAAD